jgi:tetratricopeptide (TPR) repeat protein
VICIRTFSDIWSTAEELTRQFIRIFKGAIMNALERKWSAALLVFVSCFGYSTLLSGQHKEQVQIAARVTSVVDGGYGVVINRGSRDNIVPESQCLFLPNRGEGSAEIQWDIDLALGKVTEITPESSFVSLTDVYDTVKAGDYCAVYATIPSFILETDIGLIAHWDIDFLNYESRLPLFSLSELIENPTQAMIDSIIDRLVKEVHTHADTVEAWSEGNIIKGGIFDGMGWGEAFRKTTREHVALYLEYVRYLPGRYINYPWWFISTYNYWTTIETPTAEREKKEKLAIPYAVRGDSLVDLGDYQGAIEAYKEALGINADYSYANDRVKLIENLLKHKKIIELDPKDVNSQYELAMACYDLGRYEDALLYLSKAEELGYESTVIKKYRGYCFVFLGRYADAVKIFEKLHELNSQDKNIQKWLKYSRSREKQFAEKGTAESYVQTGNVKYEEENWDGAIAEYKAALDLEPDSPEVRKLVRKTVMRKKAYQEQQWANADWDNGDFEGAKNRWMDAINICEGIEDRQCVISVLYEMANAMYDMAFNDEAIEVYKTIIELDPGEYDAYIGISNSYKGEEDYENAISWVKKGIEVDPTDAWGHNVLGWTYLEAGELDKAIAPLEKAAGMDPFYKFPHYNLARVYVLKEDYEKAEYHYGQVLEIDKDYWNARYGIEYIMCIEEAREKLKENPHDLDMLLQYGRVLWHLKDYRRCIEVLSKVTSARDDAVALSYLGYAYTDLEEYDEGMRLLKASYALKPIANTRAWMSYNESKAALAKDPNDAHAYLKSAESHLYWEHYYSALTDFSTARELGADTMLVADMLLLARKGNEARKLYDISTEHYDRAEYEKAIEYAENALVQYRSIGGKEGEMLSLQRLGWCYAGLFKHEEALENHERAGKVAEELDDVSRKAHYVSAVGDYHWNLGDYEKALEYKREARRLYHQEFDYVNEAICISSIGDLLGNLGEFDEMVSHYQKALALHRRTKYYTGESSVLNSLGWTYISDGDYSEGLGYQKECLEVARKYNDKWNELRAYGAIGNIYSDLGDTTNAKKYLSFYIESATALGARTSRADGLISLGIVYLEYIKDYEKALDYFYESRDLARLSDYTLGEGCAIASIGVVLSRQGKFEEALKYHEEGIALIRSVHSRYTEMQGLDETGETYQGMKDFEKALEFHLAAIEIAKVLGEKTHQWKFEFNAGKAYEGKGDLENAAQYYKMAAATLAGITKKIVSEELKQKFTEMERQTDVYKRLIDLLMRMGKPDEAIKYLEESKSKIVKDAFGDVKPQTDDTKLNETLEAVEKIEKKKEAIEKELTEEKKKPETEQDRTKIGKLSETLGNTEGEFNKWMFILKSQNPQMYNALTIPPTTLGDVQGTIPEKAVLLEYFISPDKLYIFCIGKHYFVAKSVEVSESELDGLVEYYLGVVQDPESDREELDEPAMQLYDYLLAPVEEELGSFENVVIVPFGALYYLPFHALIREEGGERQYVLEWKHLSYTTSATFLDILNEEERDIDKLIAIGNPDGSLPAAEEEVLQIKENIFKEDAVIWTLNEATKKNFLEFAKDYDIVHLATHGTIMSNALESYLLFAGNTEIEQRLTLLEVAGYTALRDRTDLVFLSACQTATQKGKGSGSELISLAEAIAMAGPPTLVATLWEVNDISTSKLVVSFYTELKKKKGDMLEALRTAQLSLLESSEYSHPFYWAPFVLLGNWR